MATGRSICTLYELRAAVENRKAVVVPKSGGWVKPRPAAFIYNLPGSVIYSLFGLGMFIYEKEQRNEHNSSSKAAAQDAEGVS